jgi:hypothetical protein
MNPTLKNTIKMLFLLQMIGVVQLAQASCISENSSHICGRFKTIMAESSQVLGNELAVCGGMLSGLDSTVSTEIKEAYGFNAADLNNAGIMFLEMAHRYITWSEVLRLSDREKKRWKENPEVGKMFSSIEIQKCLNRLEQ